MRLKVFKNFDSEEERIFNRKLLFFQPVFTELQNISSSKLKFSKNFEVRTETVFLTHNSAKPT